MGFRTTPVEVFKARLRKRRGSSITLKGKWRGFAYDTVFLCKKHGPFINNGYCVLKCVSPCPRCARRRSLTEKAFDYELRGTGFQLDRPWHYENCGRIQVPLKCERCGTRRIWFLPITIFEHKPECPNCNGSAGVGEIRR